MAYSLDDLKTFFTGKPGVTITHQAAGYFQVSVDCSKLSNSKIFSELLKFKGYVITDGSYKMGLKKYRFSTAKSNAVLA